MPKPYVPPPDVPSTMPDEIKRIYLAALRDGHILTCECLNWAFPVAYRIGIYNKTMMKFLKLDGVTSAEVNPEDYEIVTYILRPGKITTCPLRKTRR